MRFSRGISRFLVAFVLAIAGVRIAQDGFQVDTDPFSLLPNVPRLQEQESVRFLVEGHDANAAKAALRAQLSQLIAWRNLDLLDLEKFCTSLNPYRAALSGDKSSEVYNCRASDECLSDYFSRKISAQAFTGVMFECDPLLIFPQRLQSIVDSNQLDYILIGKLEKGSTVANIDLALSALRLEFPQTTILWSGFPRFAASSRARFDHEFALTSILSLVGIVFTIHFLFGSFFPLIVSVFSSICGFICGVALCIALKGQIHGITLSLGSSLLGACVDYSLHWLSLRYWRNKVPAGTLWKEVSPVIRLGMYTSLAAIIPFAFSGSVLLEEFLIFSTGALLGSYMGLTFFSDVVPRNSKIAGFQKASKLISWLIIHLRGVSLISTVGLLVLLGIFMLKVDDDVRLLQSPDPQLIKDELRVAKGAIPNAYLIIKGSTDTETIEGFIKVLAMFKKDQEKPGDTRLAVQLNIPNIETQRENVKQYIDYVEMNSVILKNVFSELGISIKSELTDVSKLKTLDLDFIKLIGPEIVTNAGEIILPVINWKDGLTLPASVRVVNYSSIISRSFHEYRVRGSICLIFGYALVGIVLVLYHKSISALLLLLPCAVAALMTLAVLGLTGIPLNFFGMIVLALVLGLSVDYAIFFSETEQFEAASLSVLASAATTLIAFAPLILSDTPLLRGVGVCMVVGVLTATIASPLLSVFQIKHVVNH